MSDALQQQIIELRRQHILEAAAKVFSEKGFRGSTIKAIAREADVADGTIYNYFKNKQALLIGIFDMMRQRALHDVIATINLETHDLRDVIKLFIAQPLMDMQQDNFALFRIVLTESMVNDDLRQLYRGKIIVPTLASAEPFLQHWIDQGIISVDNPKLLIRVLSALITGLIVERILDDSDLADHWHELPDFVTDLLLKGLTQS